jgi:hypothetical protein
MEAELSYQQACYKISFDPEELESLFEEEKTIILRTSCYEVNISCSKQGVSCKYYLSLLKKGECLAKERILYSESMNKYLCSFKIVNKSVLEFNELCDMMDKFKLARKLIK